MSVTKVTTDRVIGATNHVTPATNCSSISG